MINKIGWLFLIILLLMVTTQFLCNIQTIYYRFKMQKEFKKYTGKYVLVRIYRDKSGKYTDLSYVYHLSDGNFSAGGDISKALIFENQKEAFMMLKKYDWNMCILKI